jgi:flagellar basal body-associated protein FliL
MEEKKLERLEKRMNDVKDIIINALHEFESNEINKTHKL